jgi:hypothetical protein
MKKTTAMPFFLILPAGAQMPVLKGTISDTAANRNLGSVPANLFQVNKALSPSENSKIDHNNPLYARLKAMAANGRTPKSNLWHIMIRPFI